MVVRERCTFGITGKVTRIEANSSVPRFAFGKNAEPTPILLAADTHFSALAAVRALRSAGYAPWLAVHVPRTYASRSRATAGTLLVPDPSLDGEGYVREIAAAATRLSVRAVLPSAETTLLMLAGREADFAGIALGAPSRGKAELIMDKGRLPELAKAAGLQTPPTARVVPGNSEAVGAFGFPAILKPQRSQFRYPDGTVSGSSRYISASSVEEALQALPGGEGFVQPYIPGSLISVSGVSWEGELYCALHQLSIRIWPEPTGGSSYAETIPPDAELELGVGRLLQTIGWSGIFQAQFIRDPRGDYHLIDLNGRVYGSLALAMEAGLNLPGVWADLLLGRRPSVSGYRIGKRFRNEDKDLHSLARMLMDGELRHAFRGLVPRRGTTHAVFSIYDPMPLLTVAETLVKRLRR
jgi:hypothetical protein